MIELPGKTVGASGGGTKQPGAMLEARGLSKAYPCRAGALHVLRDVSLAMAAGEAAAVTGPSGSGKSTLLSILGGLEPPSGGRLLIAGRDPYVLKEPELARFRNRTVGFVFQDHHLLPQCTVLENVLVPTLPGDRDPGAAERAGQLLERVGLTERMDHLPSELSGGERQRVAVARALINRPMLLLADEPTGNLDRQMADIVVSLLIELHREQEAMLILVTHNPVLAARFGRRYELIDGTLRPA